MLEKPEPMNFISTYLVNRFVKIPAKVPETKKGKFPNCCNRLSDLLDFGCYDFEASHRHGSFSRNIQEELEAALLFQ